MSPRDERALWLSRFVLPHEPALRSWLARRSIAGLEVDDIVQETYAKLSNVDDVSLIANVRSYMFTAAHSIMSSHLRRSRIVSITSYASIEEFGLPDEAADPEQNLLAHDELQRLGQLIAAMPPRVREVLILRRIDGLTQREVAERLGISVSTVEKHIASAMRRLSDAFAYGGERKVRTSRPGKHRKASD
jgi:RNA polymerase sigma-70 factor (ECF subfamily)